MTIFELKNQIEQNKITDDPIVFLCDKDSFVIDQYIKEIARIKQLNLIYKDSIEDANQNIFLDNTADLTILKIESLNEKLSDKNLIIVTKKVDNTLENYSNIVEVPELSKIDVTEYLYSMLSIIDKKKLDWLLHVCGYNIFRLQQEIDKLKLFPEIEQRVIFDQFMQEGIFDDLTEYTIFNVSGAIIKKDIDSLKNLFLDIEKIDINDIGFITVLFKNFYDIIRVQLSQNLTAEQLGYSSKQYYGIKYSCGKYSKEQLLKIFEFLTSIDKKIKTGEMPVNILRDYMIVKILSM